MKRKDLTGKKFGRLTVIEDIAGQGLNPRLKCKCECGTVTTPFKNSIVTGSTQSCGCLKAWPEDLVGQRFGRLLVIESLQGKHDKCECDCGIVKLCNRASLKRGTTKSCGCLLKKMVEAGGVKKGLKEWAAVLGVSKQRVSELHKRGKLIERLEREV
jgi:hypothetical protein